MGKKWHSCWCQMGWSEYFETTDLLGIYHTTISSVYRVWSETEKISREQKLSGFLMSDENERLLSTHRKVTLTQIATCYN